ncbi:MAG TPA: response regulator [Alphaproteobacteria bacterium]|jgi:two-component system alkaline phosphatase synthesis response regulator PhoP
MSSASQGFVLLVDDNPVQSRLYGDVLKAEGFSVFAAPNAKEAEQFLLANMPSIILLDIMMPDVDGIEACQRFRKQIGERVPILFLTASDTVDILLAAFKAGGDDFVVKTSGITKLVERVKFWRSPASRGDALARRQAKIAQIEKRLGASTPAAKAEAPKA